MSFCLQNACGRTSFYCGKTFNPIFEHHAIEKLKLEKYI